MKIITSILSIALIISILSFKPDKKKETVRPLVDTVGFAHLAWQMDSVMSRIERYQAAQLAQAPQTGNTPWRAAICPHDDHTYVGWQYPALLKNIKAKTIIIFGVAHKAKLLKAEDQLVFDNYTYWKGTYGNIKISALREEITSQLPENVFQVNDSLQKIEHSIEGMLPFIQYYNKEVEIVPVLVPYMDFGKMNELSTALSTRLAKLIKKHNWQWGKDIALLITTDAVHYGDEDWGGKNMAPYGADSSGYAKAITHEHSIINNCLKGPLKTQKIQNFVKATVQDSDYREYKWTWCGRYSVPMGLLTALKLQQQLKAKPLTGIAVGYSNSIDHKPVPVEDLQMGKTAIATLRHWVGYASVGYK